MSHLNLRWYIMAVVFMLALAVAPTVLWAHGGHINFIHACINPSGVTRIVGANDNCNPSETAIHWSIATTLEGLVPRRVYAANLGSNFVSVIDPAHALHSEDASLLSH